MSAVKFNMKGRRTGQVFRTDDHDGTDDLRPDLGWDLQNRGLVVNFNKLFRFREGNLVSTMTALVPLSTALIGGLIEATLSPITKALTQMAGFLTYRLGHRSREKHAPKIPDDCLNGKSY